MNLCSYVDRPALIKAFAHTLVETLRPLTQTGTPSVALSGGQTPVDLFHELRNNHVMSLDWSRVLFFWGDERCVDLEDPDSNAGTAMQEFLTPIGVPEDHIFPMFQSKMPIDEAVFRYSDILRANLPIQDGIPQLDIAIQGVGEDGHTASLFPNRPWMSSKKLCFATQHPQTHQKRITLSMEMINHAKNLWVLASGTAKAAILYDIFHKKDPLLPATAISASATWFLDENAAQKLSK